MNHIKYFMLILLSAGLVGFKPADFVEPKEGELNFLEKFQRREGQKEFLNLHYNPGRFGRRGAPEAAEAADVEAGGEREFVESDVFAINVEQKLVYLLNNYRGLQVVSFQNGAEAPVLVGRVPATGNWPDKMFHDKKNSRLLVLERTEDYNKSRLLVYDVTDAENPVLKKEQTQVFDGRISAERFDVTTNTLYVVASEYHYYWRRNQQVGENRGYVYSFNIAGEKVELKQRIQLSLPAVGYRDIRLAESKVGNEYRYYVIAVLHKGYNQVDDRLAGFWSSDSSYIEVLDITNPDLIQPSLLAAVKGQIRERSQIQLRENTLIVVSNFNTFWRDSGPAQIALETFQLPTDDVFDRPIDDQAITAAERKIEAMLQIEGLRAGTDAYIARRAVLVNELLRQPFFVKGVQIINQDGKLETVARVFKPYANQEIVPKNLVGVNNIALQDVRVDDKYLYAFWVPRNLKDPLEIFDISEPTNIKYLKRLAFKQGWVEKAVPFKYNGQHLVMGLGFDRQEGSNGRQLVGMLAHISEQSDPFRPGEMKIFADEIDFKVIDESNTWSSLNIADKQFTISFTESGEGSVLMPYSRYVDSEDGGRQYERGGLKFEFSMKNFSENQSFFTAGQFRKQETGYTRRVFRNEIVDRDNAFSDRELAIFGEDVDMNNPEVQMTATYLELARNIQAYVSLNSAVGLQIISEPNYYCFWGGCDDQQAITELRLVSTSLPDVERHQILQGQEIQGNYASHAMDKVQETLYLMTQESVKRARPRIRGEEQKYDRFSINRIYSISAAGPVLSVRLSGTIEDKEQSYDDFDFGIGRPWRPWYQRKSYSFAKLSSGAYAVLGDNQKMMTVSGSRLLSRPFQCDYSAPSIEDQPGIDLEKEHYSDVKLVVLGGKPFVSYKLVNYSKEHKMHYSKNMLAEIGMGPAIANCGRAVNIPGEPTAFISGTLVTNDSWVRAFKAGSSDSWDHERENSYNALKWGSVAELTSMMKSEGYYNSSFQVVGDTIVSFETLVAANHQNDYKGSYELQFVKVMDHKFATYLRSGVRVDGGYSPRLSDVVELSGSEHLLVMSFNGKLRVASYDGTSAKLLQVAEVDHKGQVGEASENVVGGYRYYGSSGVNFTESLSTLEFANGLYGIRQVKVLR